MTMSTNTELEVRPLEDHEVERVSGAGVHIQTQSWNLDGPVAVAADLWVYGFQSNPTVTKPIELLAGAFSSGHEGSGRSHRPAGA
jgi:hypothetical protein